MCLVLDQFLWGHSSRVCDISCYFVDQMSHVFAIIVFRRVFLSRKFILVQLFSFSLIWIDSLN